MKLLTEQINLKLIRCSYFNGYELGSHGKIPARVCNDYEIEYYLKSNGGIYVDGEYIPFKAGDINIRKPGQTVCGVLPYECYIICLDIKGEAPPDDNYIFGSPKNAQPFYENNILKLLPNKFVSNKPEKINKFFLDLYRKSQVKSELLQLKIRGILYEILYEIIEQEVKQPLRNTPNKKIIEAVKYIKDNFCEEILINDLVQKSKLSKAYFHHCFKSYTDQTPAAMIRSLRIEKAKNLLYMTNSNISEISALCGYYDNVYFSYIFKRETGFTPTEFRLHP